jgi:3-hydroxyisobutyrate dehydrogenase
MQVGFSPEATAPLKVLGATRAEDLPALARAVRVTLLSLPDARAVETAVFGTSTAPGLMDGARAGDVVFDLSTVGPASTRRLAGRCAVHDVRLVDAPVSGSVSGAEAGTLYERASKAGYGKLDTSGVLQLLEPHTKR